MDLVPVSNHARVLVGMVSWRARVRAERRVSPTGGGEPFGQVKICLPSFDPRRNSQVRSGSGMSGKDLCRTRPRACDQRREGWLTQREWSRRSGRRGVGRWRHPRHTSQRWQICHRMRLIDAAAETSADCFANCTNQLAICLLDAHRVDRRPNRYGRIPNLVGQITTQIDASGK